VEDRRLILHAKMAVATHPDHPANGLEIVGEDAEYHRSAGDVEGADWSGYDHRGCLVYCRNGRLFRRGTGPGAPDEQLVDFNPLRPHSDPAPNWARQPLG
jgi:hypothetical protein